MSPFRQRRQHHVVAGGVRRFDLAREVRPVDGVEVVARRHLVGELRYGGEKPLEPGDALRLLIVQRRPGPRRLAGNPRSRAAARAEILPAAGDPHDRVDHRQGNRI